jgi:hypothetical protein
MPQLGPALISLAKLIALLDANGTVRWAWFADPASETMQGIPANREQLGVVVRALLDRQLPGQDAVFNADLAWEPVNLGDQVQAGFAWTPAGVLRIAFGVKAAFALGSQPLDLTVAARLVSISPQGSLAGEVGQVRFAGNVPVPDFLQSATLDGEVGQAITFDLTIVDADGRSRTMAFVPNPVIQWDAARLATFVLQAWVHQLGTGAPDGFFGRADEHLFPMLGDPETTSIKAFPLVGDTMGQSFNVDPWKNSVLTSDNNAAGALTFLWHLRALLTGNESPEFFDGSFWFPLVAGQIQGNPPAPGDSDGQFAPGPNSAWFGITTANNVFTLVLDLRDGAAASHPIVLAQVQGGTLTRPVLDAGTFAALGAYLSSAAFPLTIGDGAIETAADAGRWRVTLAAGTVSATGLDGFDGTYSLQLYLEQGQPAAYRLVTPSFELALPPAQQLADGQLLFATILRWVLGALPASETGALGELPKILGQFIRDAVDPNASPDTPALIAALAAAIGGVTIDIGPAEIAFEGSHIKPSIGIGPLEPGDMADLPIHIGKVQVGADILAGPSQASLEGLSVSLLDVRLGSLGGGNATGLVASLLPDLREMPGFSISFTTPDSLVVVGGGKIPIQESIGPLDLVALLVDLREESLSVGIDLAFQLAMIRVSAYELGVQFTFSDGGAVPFLHGLGVSCDTDVFTLAGMFAEVKTDAGSDYVGGAVVSVAGLFELTAIGGYTESEGEASLFIFASLVAPLGGPPWFFITGIAGGFGYNRSLPPPGLLTKHPFIMVMTGEIVVSGEATKALTDLSAHFTALTGNHWVAAGIQFTCFGFIQGKVVVAVSFGQKFSITLLGLAAFGIKPLAYFELGIEATADEEQFLVKAGLSSNSYLVHPDIFSLRGDFALGVWHSGDHSGDFVLSVGGYHPYFKAPGHYPTLQRVGCSCTLYGFIRLTVDCFFACTPQAIMAGASVSLSAEFAGIGAGLDVYIDVFIRWDPFFLQARMGVVVWFEFCGRHEIGVQLRIHTPPFGGVAVIDLALVSFEVEFGSSLDKLKAPPLHEFVTRQLGVPAAAADDGARVATFNTSEGAGLTRVDFHSGRSAEPEQKESSEQEGLNAPVRVAAEFSFSVRTRLPLNIPGISEEVPPSPALTSEDMNLPLCELFDRTSTLSVSAPGIGDSGRSWLADYFPAAHFGGELSAAQADDVGARQAVAKIDPTKGAVALVEGVLFDYRARDKPESSPALSTKPFETPTPDEAYPLPFGWPQAPIVARMPKGTLKFSAAPLTVAFAPKAPLVNRRTMAIGDLAARTWPPLRVVARAAGLQRHVLPFPLGGLTMAEVPAGSAVAVPPPSPPRRAELFGVTLRVLPPVSPVRLVRRRMETLTRAPKADVRDLTPTDGPVTDAAADLQVETGRAVSIDVMGGRRNRIALAITGSQMIRAIAIGGGGELIADEYISRSRTLSPPPRTRRIVVIGEGTASPVAPVAGATVTVAREAVGMERDTIVLALGRRTFAAHGCVVVANVALPFRADPLDSLPGRELFDHVTSARAHFPMMPGSCSLVVTVRADADEPGLAAEEVRWATLDARLGELTTLVGAGRTAFVMPVAAPGPWILDVDLGHRWRLASLVASPHDARTMAARLRATSDWNLVNDTMVSARPAVSRVALKVNR